MNRKGFKGFKVLLSNIFTMLAEEEPIGISPKTCVIFPEQEFEYNACKPCFRELSGSKSYVSPKIFISGISWSFLCSVGKLLCSKALCLTLCKTKSLCKVIDMVEINVFLLSKRGNRAALCQKYWRSSASSHGFNACFGFVISKD